jgi:hypothetical protein
MRIRVLVLELNELNGIVRTKAKAIRLGRECVYP